jgi:hyaluronoglucosaminidase
VRRTAALAAIVGALVAAAPAQAEPAWRGIIEGAYGTPWDHAARMRILSWMPKHHFKQYVHAPKEELYQRTLWRSPYPAGQMREFTTEIARARRLHLQWIPNVSPGLPQLPSPGVIPSAPLCFSCPEDVQAIVAKFEPFLGNGVRTVMVSFDDVQETLARDDDRAAFGDGPGAYGTATASFLNRVYDALQAGHPGTQLLTVPADYAGTRDTPYLQGLRAALRPAIQVMWTGTRIRSGQWTADDARAYSALVGRTPIVWDNWTNNDFVTDPGSEATARLFLGPYSRPSSVAGSVAGWFFNPASEADVNMLPLATAGAWVHNPWSYDRRAAWLDAVRQLAGTNAQSLRAFAESSYSTRLSRIEGPTFVRLSKTFMGAYDGGAYWPRALAELRNELLLAQHARTRLARMPNRAFFHQAGPYLNATADSAGTAMLAALLREYERPTLRAVRTNHGSLRVRVEPPRPERAAMRRTKLDQARIRLSAQRRLVYGWRPFDGLARPVYAAPNVLDTFLDDVAERDQAYQQRADQAAAGVTLTLNGQPAPPPVNGVVGLSGGDCGLILVAQDAAGGQSSLRLPACR